MFEADGDADESIADTCGRAFFGGQLGMGGAGGMGGDAAGVTEVGGQGQHFEVVQETPAAFEAAFQFEADDASAIAHLTLGDIVLGMAGEEGIFQ